MIPGIWQLFPHCSFLSECYFCVCMRVQVHTYKNTYDISVYACSCIHDCFLSFFIFVSLCISCVFLWQRNTMLLDEFQLSKIRKGTNVFHVSEGYVQYWIILILIVCILTYLLLWFLQMYLLIQISSRLLRWLRIAIRILQTDREAYVSNIR